MTTINWWHTKFPWPYLLTAYLVYIWNVFLSKKLYWFLKKMKKKILRQDTSLHTCELASSSCNFASVPTHTSLSLFPLSHRNYARNSVCYVGDMVICASSLHHHDGCWCPGTKLVPGHQQPRWMDFDYSVTWIKLWNMHNVTKNCWIKRVETACMQYDSTKYLI